MKELGLVVNNTTATWLTSTGRDSERGPGKRWGHFLRLWPVNFVLRFKGVLLRTDHSVIQNLQRLENIGIVVHS